MVGQTTAVAQGDAAAERPLPDATANPAAPDTGRGAVLKPAPRYFVEFRSRFAISYGHTFVVHGRVGEKITAQHVAGLHPRGDSSVTCCAVIFSPTRPCTTKV